MTKKKISEFQGRLTSTTSNQLDYCHCYFTLLTAIIIYYFSYLSLLFNFIVFLLTLISRRANPTPWFPVHPQLLAGTYGMDLRRGTSTKSFGTGKREGHDSSAFYGRKLCAANPTENGCPQITEISPHHLNCIFPHSSEQMPELPDNSVALMVTSPPYNVGKDYDLDLTLEEYLGFLKQILSETHRVLIPGGRIAFNVANLGRKPYIPLNSHVANLASDLGLLMRGEIIWVKGKGAGGSCAWGSWMSAGNPTLRDLHEYVLIFSITDLIGLRKAGPRSLGMNSWPRPPASGISRPNQPEGSAIRLLFPWPLLSGSFISTHSKGKRSLTHSWGAAPPPSLQSRQAGTLSDMR